MTTTLKSNEALSHGHVMRIKKEESKTINDQTNAFFGRGGKITELADNQSGVEEDAKYKFYIPKESK